MKILKWSTILVTPLDFLGFFAQSGWFEPAQQILGPGREPARAATATRQRARREARPRANAAHEAVAAQKCISPSANKAVEQTFETRLFFRQKIS
jgi:hypothetical protein